MKELSLYIHIPFCKKKCNYCDFASFPNKDDYHENYVKSLILEIKEKSILSKDFTVTTIFFGGGTPTFLSEQLITSIMDTINCNFKIHKTAEISIEANPATFDFNKLVTLKKIGFNRISLGLQAWQNPLLEKLGRLHTIEEFIENFSMVKKAGFENINIDIMFALPNQNLNMWKETLSNVVNLNPTHISVYSLIIEEGTPFYSDLELGNITITDEDLDRDMYHYAQSFLGEKGYSQYEISNFSKSEYQCKHNIVYWSMKNYMGLGLSSHSYFNNERFHNTYNIDEYITTYENQNLSININNHKILKLDLEILTENDIISEYMFLGLRMNKGISKNNFQNRFNKTINDVYPNIIETLINDNLLVETEDCIYLTQLGFDLSNLVFEKFLL